jgi:hypothetical protein
MNNIPQSNRHVNLTQVLYNRKEAMWEARNGRVWQYPSGPAGKRQAQLYALDHDVPLIADEVRSLIALAQGENPNSQEAEAVARRALKAGFLIRNGHVLPPRAFDAEGSYLNEIARVRSSSQTWPDGSTVEYGLTQLDNGSVWCSCPDFADQAPYLPSRQKACKHILAVLICEALDMDLADEQGRATGLHSEALTEAISQAEVVYHELSTLLLVMRQTRDELSHDSVARLEAALYPYINSDRKLCFDFEVDFNAIVNDLDDGLAAQPLCVT